MKDRARITVKQTQRLALNHSLHASIRVLGADAAGIALYLEELAAQTPELRVAPPPDHRAGEWLPRWREAFRPPELPEAAAPGPSLLAHVMERAPRLTRNRHESDIALALAEALEPSGWLGRPLSLIAAECHAQESEVEAVLVRLQRIDPPGLFARNLSECLRIQAMDAGLMDLPLAMMLDNLDLVARGNFARLARLADTEVEGIRARLRLIRSFDPKPGARFAPFSASQIREPDLIVQRHTTGWRVSLNRSSLPSVSVDGQGPGASTARAAIEMIERRNSTLLAVAQEILRRQSRALDHGRTELAPMTMAEVATSLGIHESTVSRVVAGASADTPQGTLWLRALFSPGVAGMSGAALRERLSQMIAREDPSHPLSDQELAERLAPDGALARRTVAKYRAELAIPTAANRRRRPKRKPGRLRATGVGKGDAD